MSLGLCNASKIPCSSAIITTDGKSEADLSFNRLIMLSKCVTIVPRTTEYLYQTTRSLQYIISNECNYQTLL